jgi:hypothetical protein
VGPGARGAGAAASEAHHEEEPVEQKLEHDREQKHEHKGMQEDEDEEYMDEQYEDAHQEISLPLSTDRSAAIDAMEQELRRKHLNGRGRVKSSEDRAELERLCQEHRLIYQTPVKSIKELASKLVA